MGTIYRFFFLKKKYCQQNDIRTQSKPKLIFHISRLGISFYHSLCASLTLIGKYNRNTFKMSLIDCSYLLCERGNDYWVECLGKLLAVYEIY